MWPDRFRSYTEPRQTPDTPELNQKRSSRFHLDVAVSFVADRCTYTGQPVNLSDSGLLARCDQPPELWTHGQLVLEAGERYLNINARVARLQDNNVGFAFPITSESDRAAISILIGSTSDRPLAPGD